MDIFSAPTTVYRVDGPPNRGLWYNPDGKFVGEIHNNLSFCHASALEMPYDKTLVGWRSCTETLEDLLLWISLEEFVQLESRGFKASVYEAHQTKTYIHIDHATGLQMPHLVFKKDAARLIRLLSVRELGLQLEEDKLISSINLSQQQIVPR